MYDQFCNFVNKIFIGAFVRYSQFSSFKFGNIKFKEKKIIIFKNVDGNILANTS